MSNVLIKKIILFGAIKNINLLFESSKWANVIAIIDNDNSKHGTIINGIVVYDLLSIKTFDYDEILVLPWDFTNIFKQLVEIGVPEYKIKSVNKREVSSSVFSDSHVRSSALSFISELCNFFNSKGLKLFVEAGTLLGIVRDKDLIHWDSDIDFSVADEDFVLANDAILEFAVKYRNQYFVNINEVNHIGIRQIVGVIQISNVIIPFDIFTRYEVGSSSVSKSGDFFKCNSNHFKDTSILKIGNLIFTVPLDCKRYLSNLYGDDWMIPKKDFSYSDFVINK